MLRMSQLVGEFMSVRLISFEWLEKSSRPKNRTAILVDPRNTTGLTHLLWPTFAL